MPPIARLNILAATEYKTQSEEFLAGSEVGQAQRSVVCKSKFECTIHPGIGTAGGGSFKRDYAKPIY